MEKSERPIPREIAEQAELDSLLSELDRMPTDLFDVGQDNKPKRSKELAILQELSSRVYQNLWELEKTTDPKSPEHECVARLLGASGESGPISKLNSSIAVVVEFANKLDRGNVADEAEKELVVAALRDASNQARLVVRELMSTPVQSIIRARTGPTIKKIIRTMTVLASFGLLGGGISGTRERVKIERVQKHGGKIPKEHKFRKDNEDALITIDYEDGDGGGMRRGAGPKKKPGKEMKTNIYSPESGPPGELPRGRQFAEIDFSTFGGIEDSLWVDSVATRHPDGKFRIIEQKVDSVGSEVVATVALTSHIIIRGNYEIALWVPIGFTVGKVFVEPPVPFDFDQNSRSLAFKGGPEEGINISYEVVSAKETFILPESVPQHLNRTQDQLALIEQLKNLPDKDTEEILDKYLSSFVYITSNELQRLLEKMPGSDEEKAGALKLGDCDVLSMHVAGLLTDAGKTSIVAGGYAESGGGLSEARAHAKLVYIAENGEAVSYESTAPTKDAFVNLKFSEEDGGILEELASQMSENDTPEVQLQKYENFRQELERILEKGEYDDFNPKKVIEILKKLFESLVKFAGGEGKVGNEDFWFIIKIIAAEFALVAALFGAILGVKAGLSRLSRKTKLELDAEAATFFKSKLQAIDGGGIDEEEKKDDYVKEDQLVMSRVKDVYGRNANFHGLYPLKEVKKLSLKQKRDLLVVFGAAEIIFPMMWDMGVLDFFRGMEAGADWEKVVKKLEAEGLPVSELFEKVREVISDPKIKAEFAKNIPKKVANIVSVGAQMGARINRGMKKEQTRSTANKTLQAFGIRQLGGAAKLRRGHAVVAPGDFEDFTPYQPGMDPRRIDQRLLARSDKSMMRRSLEEGRGKEPKLNFNLVIDIDSVTDADLENLAAMILYLQRNPDDINIETISFFVFGKPVDHFDKKITDKLLSTGGGSVPVLIEKVVKLKLEHSISEFVKKSVKKRWRDNLEFGKVDAAVGGTRPAGLSPGAKCLYLGNRYSLARMGMEAYHDIFTFSEPENKKTASG